MNDEIKEILDRIETASEIFDFLLEPKECSDLLDYITNLQQENERLKERCAYLERSNDRREDTIIDLRFEVAEQEDYKSRCEKASEYIYKQKKKMYKSRNKIAMFILMKLENILQNGSEINDI